MLTPPRQRNLIRYAIRRLGYPLFETFISRSPKIEALYTNPKGRALSILHGAKGSLIHRQVHHLADDVLAVLEKLAPHAGAAAPPSAHCGRVPE